MFIPNAFNMADKTEQHKFMHEFGFAIILSSNGELSATHLPFILKSDEGEHGTLYSHCAKANPHWQAFDNTQVLIIFSGPHSYISPSWYAKKPAVPTWNYAAVHAYGSVSLLGPQDTLHAVNLVVEKYEPNLLNRGDIVTDSLKQKMLPAIVGFKVELSKIEGQQKLSQNKNMQDQLGVYKALSTSDNLADLALAKYMREHNIDLDNNIGL